MSEFHSQKYPKRPTFSNAYRINKNRLREGNCMSGHHYTWEESPVMCYVFRQYVLFIANNFQTSHHRLLYTQGTNVKARCNWKTKTLHYLQGTILLIHRIHCSFFFHFLCFNQSSYSFTLYSELLTAPSNQQQKEKHVTKESRVATC